MRSKLTLKQEILLLVAVGLITLAVLLTIVSSRIAHEALMDENKIKITLALDTKKKEINHYFDEMVKDIKFLSSTYEVNNFIDSLLTHKINLKLTPDATFPVDTPELDAITLPHEKQFQNFAKSYGYYDMFILSADGLVLYSVEKESDYGANLSKGFLKDSGLALAWEKAKKSKVVSFTDMQPYIPSNNSPQMFVSYPIIKKDKVIAVLAFQISHEPINKILSYRKGYSGSHETFLVGEDKLMRSDAFMDMQNRSLKASFNNPELGSMDTIPVNRALSGESATILSRDYKGIEILVSFSSIHFSDFKWVIISKVYASEIDVVPDKIVSNLIIGAGLILALVLFTALSFISHRVLRPLEKLKNNVIKIADEKDISKRMSLENYPEYNHIAQSVNHLLDKITEQTNILQEQKEELQAADEELRSSNEELTATVEELNINNEEIIASSDALKASQQELIDKSKELERSNRYKSEFLANMSHELRTPLNSMMILSEDLKDNSEKTLTKEQLESVEVIHESGEMLLVLINDILDLAKCEAGMLDLNFETLSVQNIIDKTLRNFAHVGKNKEIEFSIKKDESLDFIKTDSLRITQIINNLLSNAFKFTDKGGKVSISFNNLIDTKSFAIVVKDNGIGIPENMLNSIFDNFKQVDSANTRKYSGTGLGLTISNKLAILMGGALSVTSKEGEGSTFTLTLPLAYKNTYEESKSIESISLTAKNISKKILVIDAQNALDSVIKNLQEDDFHVNKQNDFTILPGNELSQNDTVLINISLRINESLAFLKKNFNDTLTSKIPVVIFSESDLSESEELLFLEYAERIIVKSNHYEAHIIEEIKYSLSKNKIQEPVEQHDSADHNEQFEGKKVLIVDDNMKNLFSLSRVLRKKGFDVILAQDGQKAIDQLHSALKIDIVLMDIMMPVMDGYETIELIRKDPNLSALPIIALTAKSMPEDKQRCFDVGANAYSRKPVEIKSLIKTISEFL